MRTTNQRRWLPAALVTSGLLLSGCSAAADLPITTVHDVPAEDLDAAAVEVDAAFARFDEVYRACILDYDACRPGEVFPEVLTGEMLVGVTAQIEGIQGEGRTDVPRPRLVDRSFQRVDAMDFTDVELTEVEVSYCYKTNRITSRMEAGERVLLNNNIAHMKGIFHYVKEEDGVWRASGLVVTTPVTDEPLCDA